jgi:mono/diheme cytochrome c family protein
MTHEVRSAGRSAVFLLCVAACASQGQPPDESAPAPVDSSAVILDTTVAVDTLATPDTGVATPPITPPSPAASDTPPSGTSSRSQSAAGKQQIGQAEYEGWRQYSVNCARCHGQDVLPNPVAANLLISLAPGGPMAAADRFAQVVSEGRPERGMPAFKSILNPEQIQAIYAYVKGRADKRIPPGRPAEPAG